MRHLCRASSSLHPLPSLYHLPPCCDVLMPVAIVVPNIAVLPLAIVVPPVAVIVPRHRVARCPRFAAQSCRSLPYCRLSPSSCRMSPCCPLRLLCRPSPSSCCVVMLPVALVLPRCRAAFHRCRAACCSAAQRRHRSARRCAALCRRCAAHRLVTCRRLHAARCHHRATSSYRPSPSLCCPLPC